MNRRKRIKRYFTKGKPNRYRKCIECNGKIDQTNFLEDLFQTCKECW